MLPSHAPSVPVRQPGACSLVFLLRVKGARLPLNPAAIVPAAGVGHAGHAGRTATKMKNFTQKLALITGGSSGIGLALAKRLAQLGADVWIAARRPEQLKIALDEIENCRLNPAQRFGTIQLDVSDESQVDRELNKFLNDVGTPDLLVNNAGLTRPGEILTQDSEIFRWLMNVNYFGALYVTKCIVPAMVKRRTGHIVNVSSGAGFIPLYGYGAYGATKYALRGFSDVLRSELKGSNINVSVVMPADVDTPQHDEEMTYLPEITKKIVGDNEVLMKPEAVAEEIIRGIRRNDYVILPGFFLKVYYFLYNLGTLGYWVMDLMLADAHKKLAQGAASAKVKS